MSLTIQTDRSTLIAEARQQWQLRAEIQQMVDGKPIPLPPSDMELVAEDVQLSQEIQRVLATQSTQTAAPAATPAASGTNVNVTG